MDDFSQNEAPRTNRRLLVIVSLVGLALCLATAVAGYAIGRASATPQVLTETVTETREVTRQVEVPVTAENSDAESAVADSEEAVESPELPTAVPTEPQQQSEPEAEPLDLANLDTAVFDEVWQLIEEEYYGDLPSNDELMEAAIEGSLNALDDNYTTYTPPDIAELLREDFGGSVEGIGAFVRENEEGFVEIVAPIEGQPAEAAGLLPGDLVLEVDGASVLGENFYAVIAKVRGPRGTDVTLKIFRPSTEEELDFTITRARFEVPTVEAEMLDNNIAYLKLTEFGGLAAEQVTTELQALLDQDPQALILDLRNNPGGFVDQCVAIADLFMTDNVVLYQRDSQGGENVYRADDGDFAEQVPLVVLVNAASASASEIVAGAIQDTERGTVIGDITFGKGSVQLLHTLSDGSELRVTIARWFTPDDHSINGVGITPDIEVPDDLETPDVDEQLDRAIEFILNGQ